MSHKLTDTRQRQHVAGPHMLIHTYWDGEQLPKFQRECMASWLRHIPSAAILIWNDTTAIEMGLIQGSNSNYSALPYYRKSDFVRVIALHKFGGIWMDSSVCLRANPLHLTVNTHKLFRGYTMPGCKAVENWAFAAPPGHQVLREWSVEMRRLIFHGDREYIASAPSRVIDNWKLRQWLPYLASHLALAIACERVSASSMSLLPSKAGPLWHVPLHSGTGNGLIDDLCSLDARGVWYHISRCVGLLQLYGALPAPFSAAVKFRAIDRDFVMPWKHLTLPWSPLRRYFG